MLENARIISSASVDNTDDHVVAVLMEIDAGFFSHSNSAHVSARMLVRTWTFFGSHLYELMFITLELTHLIHCIHCTNTHNVSLNIPNESGNLFFGI